MMTERLPGKSWSNESWSNESWPNDSWPDYAVILYDGICIFCSRWVRFVAERDVAQKFRFTAIQSNYGRRLAETFGIDAASPDTNAMVLDGKALFKSDAALAVVGALPRWRWARVLTVVPKPLRDALYDIIARNRYRIFGTYNECYLGDASFRSRVLD
jgi:predicted DCC family thiol-disulfide oxidoreductase YuxK